MSTNQLTDTQIASYAAQAGFQGNSLVIAIAVCLAESNGVANAQHYNFNGTTDYGLWQINSVHSQYNSDLLITNPLYNAQAAFALSSSGRNWGPWTTYNTGAYLKYMARGQLAASLVSASKGTPTTTTTLTQNPTPMKSIPLWCQPFMAHSAAWWEANGYHYPTGASSEGGVDWTPSPSNAPITALLPGVVVGAGYFCGGGPWNLTVGGTCASKGKGEGWGVVTIRSTNPYPNLVPGAMIDIYYQHIRIAPSIQLNFTGGQPSQVIQQGQQIGNGNGSFNIEVGVNIGTQWGPIWGGKSPGPHVDPIPFLWTLINSGIAGGSVVGGIPGLVGTGIGGTLFGPTKTYTPLTEQVHETLVNTPGFYGIALSLDEAEQFPGFIDLTQSEQVDIPIGAFGTEVGDITLPVPDVTGGVRSVGATITDNFVPFAIRSGLVLFGSFLFVMLFMKAISGPVMEALPYLMEAA